MFLTVLKCFFNFWNFIEALETFVKLSENFKNVLWCLSMFRERFSQVLKVFGCFRIFLNVFKLFFKLYQNCFNFFQAKSSIKFRLHLKSLLDGFQNFQNYFKFLSRFQISHSCLFSLLFIATRLLTIHQTSSVVLSLSLNLPLMMQKAVIPFWNNRKKINKEGGEGARKKSSSSIHRFFNFFLASLASHSFCRHHQVASLLLNVERVRKEISCHYYLSSFPPPSYPSSSSTIVGVIFSIKFIHLLIIAVNHSSCNEFYEFLLMHAGLGSFFVLFFFFLYRSRPYSSLLSIIISPTVFPQAFFCCWNSRWVQPKEAATHPVFQTVKGGVGSGRGGWKTTA